LLPGLIVIGLAGRAANRHGASKEFGRQWQTIRPGMTESEAHNHLGRPCASYIPTDGTNLIEYWLFEPSQFLLVPPSNSYQIHYDHAGRVAEFFGPSPEPKTN
jgi:hypothetical protein